MVRRADGRYALGPYAHHLGRAYEATYRLTETILPLLQALVDKGTESASFHAYHDAQSRVCLLRVDSHHSTLDRIRTGDLLPLDGAAGRLLTAYLVDGETPAQAGLVRASMGERDPSCAAVASPCSVPTAKPAARSRCPALRNASPAAIKKMSKLVQESAAAAPGPGRTLPS